MAENSKIEWTDHTFNPWEGCQKVGPGCDHCYAEARNARFGGGTAVNWGPGALRRRTSVANWNLPLKWNRQAQAAIDHWEESGAAMGGYKPPKRPKVFCASLADVFDNAVDPNWRADLFQLIEKTPNLDWLLLTKRIGNVIAMMNDVASRLFWLDHLDDGALPENVWLGASIVNREEMLREGPKLKAIPAKVTFWSAEPLLGDLGVIPRELMPGWVIVGGESGAGARPMHPDWARSLRDQCAAAGVPFLFKQWGEWAPSVIPNSVTMECIGKKAAGRLLDGVQHDGYPEAAL